MVRSCMGRRGDRVMDAPVEEERFAPNALAELCEGLLPKLIAEKRRRAILTSAAGCGSGSSRPASCSGSPPRGRRTSQPHAGI